MANVKRIIRGLDDTLFDNTNYVLSQQLQINFNTSSPPNAICTTAYNYIVYIS